MRLYRFVKTDDKIDVVVATDGSCGQKRVFITESPRGVVVPGQTGATDDQKEGSDAFLALGWKWNVGETVQHEDLVEFAGNNALTLTIEPQGLNEIVSVKASWNSSNICILEISTAVPAEKEVEIYFLNTVTLKDSVGRYGTIRGDKKVLISKVNGRTPMEFSLADLGLSQKEDLNLVVMSDDGVQKFEVVAH